MIEEQKKSWTEQARERLAKWVFPDKGSDVVERTLHKASVDIITDQKLENRIRALYEFQKLFAKRIKVDSLKDYVEELQQRTELLNDVITLTAMPYATSGNYPLYQKKYSAWQVFYTSAKSLLLHAEEEINPLQTEEKKNEEKESIEEDKIDLRKFFAMEHGMLLRNMHEALQKHYWKEGFNFMNQCFRDKHVTERAVTVIKSLQQPTQRTITPARQMQLKEKKPSRDPFPERLEESLD